MKQLGLVTTPQRRKADKMRFISYRVKSYSQGDRDNRCCVMFWSKMAWRCRLLVRLPDAELLALYLAGSTSLRSKAVLHPPATGSAKNYSRSDRG